MLGYFICIGTVVMLVLLVKQTITKEEAAVWILVVYSCLLIKIFLYNLNKKYYHKKTYLWNLIFGMFLIFLFNILFALVCLDYIESKIYHFSILALGNILFDFGTKKLLCLKLQDDASNKEIIEQLNKASLSLKKTYFFVFTLIIIYVYMATRVGWKALIC